MGIDICCWTCEGKVAWSNWAAVDLEEGEKFVLVGNIAVDRDLMFMMGISFLYPARLETR